MSEKSRRNFIKSSLCGVACAGVLPVVSSKKAEAAITPPQQNHPFGYPLQGLDFKIAWNTVRTRFLLQYFNHSCVEWSTYVILQNMYILWVVWVLQSPCRAFHGFRKCGMHSCNIWYNTKQTCWIPCKEFNS